MRASASWHRGQVNLFRMVHLSQQEGVQIKKVLHESQGIVLVRTISDNRDIRCDRAHYEQQPQTNLTYSREYPKNYCDCIADFIFFFVTINSRRNY